MGLSRSALRALTEPRGSLAPRPTTGSREGRWKASGTDTRSRAMRWTNRGSARGKPMPRHAARISDNDVGSSAIGIAQKCSPAAGTDSPAALLLPRTCSRLDTARATDFSFCFGPATSRSGSAYLVACLGDGGEVSAGPDWRGRRDSSLGSDVERRQECRVKRLAAVTATAYRPRPRRQPR